MVVKKGKVISMSDGLFEQKGPSLEIENPSAEELEKYFIKPFTTEMSIEYQLNAMETRIKKLLDLPSEEDPKTNTALGRNHKEYHDKFKHLEPIKGHARNALLRLKIARESLSKKHIENAMVNTIFMMNAYWMGVMHTKQIKSSIIRDNLSTPPKKQGGNMTGGKKSVAAKPEHEKIIELARPLVEKNDSRSNIARILRVRHGIELGQKQITNILKKHFGPSPRGRRS